jgi:hypothetical protein
VFVFVRLRAARAVHSALLKSFGVVTVGHGRR